MSPDPNATAIAEAVRAVRSRIGEAAARAGRDPGEITLLAATKSVSPQDAAAAVRAGVRVVGENIVQEMLAKQEALRNETGLRWDFIGTLQRNKVSKIAGRVALIHSVDSVELAEAVGRRAAGEPQDILLEVNTSGESTKHGFAPEGIGPAGERIAALAGVRVRGVMTIAPPGDPGAARACFARLASIVHEPWWPAGATELSMGMSDDFEAAVEEGATIVRVGSAIFGARCDLGLGA